tara:strand:+ start:229 stop:738 length:510 start_codon:yes stop_codon:yes gene_type:complete
MDQIFSTRLYELPRKLKLLCFLTVFNITVGVGVGLYYVGYTTQYSPSGTSEHFAGSKISDDFDIPDKYPKPFSELLNTTHTHVISMTFIFIITGGIFFFNSIITGSIKTFLIVEPFISIIVTFGGIWFVRFIHPGFSYLVILSGILMYLSFFIMASTIFYELSIKPSQS